MDLWGDILIREIWELSSRSNGSLPALMLSYNDVPAHFKQRFAYFDLEACFCVSEPYDAFRIQKGEIGSKIIVTTRKESVVLMMGCGAINLGTLFDEVSWAVFKRHSLENRDPKEHPELEEVGKQIAHGCKGLPLALKALSSLMLSYSDLSAPLKQCFAYCAIFPKDLFCNVQVIHLWIANGLVQQFHSGNQYFLDLRSRSLFEWVPESSKRDIEKFLMHDLVNDFAQMSSSELCIRLEENEGSHKLKQ
ncbi:hypothetical protein BC332_28470 [Capsicum chinense]|nr:hypothetical protein BC332_28470 [Capsicum chinense]